MNRLWILLAVAMSTAGSAPAVATVIVHGKEWQQVADLTGLTRDAIAAVCNDVTGACTGTLNTTDVTGWTWATVDDVGSLFKFVSETHNAGGEATHPGSGFATTLEPDSTWGPAFIDLLSFAPTSSDPGAGLRRVMGLTREASDPPIPAGLAKNYGFAFVTVFADPGLADAFATQLTQLLPTDSSPERGVWIFRQAVPEPATALLLASGVAGMTWRGRRRRS